MAGSRVWGPAPTWRHPERCKPKTQVGPAPEPPNHGIVLPDAGGSRSICDLPRSDSRRHPRQESQEPARDAAGTRWPVDISLLALGQPGDSQRRGEERTGDRTWQGKAKPRVPRSGCAATSFRGWSCWWMPRTSSRRAPRKGSLIWGCCSVPCSVLGRKHGLVSTRKAEGKGSELLQSRVLGSPNPSFVTGLGQCHSSAPAPQTRSSSVLPALPWPAELAGGERNKTVAVWQDTPPSCRAAAAVR